MKKTANKGATDRPPVDRSETPAPSGQKKTYRLLVTSHGPKCDSIKDENGATIVLGEFRQVDWATPLKLASCCAGVARALGGDSLIVGQSVGWLGTTNGCLRYGALLHVSDELKPADLRGGLGYFFAHAMKDAPLSSPVKVPEQAREKIERLAQAVAAAANAAIETPVSISIHDELPVEVWGTWATPARKPCPDTHHEMIVGWDGVRFSKRRVFVFSGEDALDVGYDEVKWEAQLREVFSALAQGMSPSLRIAYKTVTMGKRKANVLTNLEILPVESRQEIALA